VSPAHRTRLDVTRHRAGRGVTRHHAKTWSDGPPATIYLGVVCNAAFYGLISVALPLALVGSGATKVQITLFFGVNAVVAAGLNLIGGPALRRRGSPWWAASLCGLVAAAATLVVLGTAPAPAMYPAGAATMTMTLIFPHYIGIINGYPGPSPARLVGRMRRLFVLGFIGGLALSAVGELVHQVDADFQPLWLAAALALGNGVVPWRETSVSAGSPPAPASSRPVPASSPPQPASRTSGARRRGAPAAVLIIVVAVLLLRAADSVRLVYLPLYAVSHGVSGAFVAALFFVSVIAEVPVLGPISSYADRVGSRRALIVITAFGVASFGLLTTGGGPAVLISSQLLYAVFAAGFQSIGMVLLGEVLRGGLAAGADIYTGMVQVGAVAGVVAPLLVPGYSAWLFVLGTGFCLCSLLMLALPRSVRSVTATLAVPGPVGPAEPAGRARRG
jgi:hypothetical protein